MNETAPRVWGARAPARVRAPARAPHGGTQKRSEAQIAEYRRETEAAAAARAKEAAALDSAGGKAPPPASRHRRNPRFLASEQISPAFGMVARSARVLKELLLP